ncbi:hypothetical protein LXL04_018311 [Taraxacum kok-saghyz]
MAITSQEHDNLTDDYPLLTNHPEPHENHQIIDVERGSSDASSSGSSNGPNPNPPGRRGERWNPFNSLLWISIEMVFTTGQIIAAIFVLSISQHEQEHPQNPLFAWVIGYAAGCAATLPLLYWRYLHRNQSTGQRAAQLGQPRSERNTPPEPSSYITISFAPSSQDQTHQTSTTTTTTTSSDTWNGLNVSGSNVSMLVDRFKMALDCFFAVWFVVGNVWIFGDQSSSSDAPNLYRLSIVFLGISCIGYAMPFILCGMICCCFPCIVSVLGIREDMNQIRGASQNSINALPTHTFKSKEHDSGGVVESGTEKERTISGEDAVCCICLAKYKDGDLLREIPCTHFFHTECVDKWLKINASCPLCKFEIHGDLSSTQEA